MKKTLLIFITWGLLSLYGRAQMLNPFIDQLVTPPTWGWFYWPSMQFLHSINGQLEIEELVNGTWQKDSKFIITLDGHGNFTNYKWYEWDAIAGNWVASMDYEASTDYNGQGQLTHWKYWGSFDNQYPSNTSRTLSYNASGQYASITGIDSMNYGGMWLVSPIADEMVYDGLGRIVERWVHSTNPAAFTPGYKLNISYDGSGNITEANYQTEFFGSTENYMKFVYTHNPNGTVKTIHWYEDDNGNYVISSIDSLQYPSSNAKIHIRYEDVDGNGTVDPDTKAYFYYDNSGNLLYVVSYSYNNGWVKNDSIRYYYSKGRPETSLGYKWLGSAYSPDPYQRGFFSNYLTGLESPINQSNGLQLTITPNPVDNVAVISGPDFNRIWKATLHQFDGKLVRSFELSSPELNVGDLPAGVYILKLVGGKQTYTGKILKK